jgi:hypothetical protein
MRKLVTLPLALATSCGLALAVGSSSACGLDCIGRRTEVMRGDVCYRCSLASRVCGMPRGPAQISGRAHSMAARRAGQGHRNLAPHPGAGMLDRLARPRVPGLSRIEEVKDVLRAR